MALDLCVPPLASLVLAASALAVLAAGYGLLGGFAAPLVVALIALAAIGVAVVLAWRGFGRHIVSGGDLLCAPAYVLRKIPIYLRLFAKRQVDWVRTKRDDRAD
ncbi:MAG: hypothetical protein M3Y67_11555 [Pseudomonadota bacterium]|nr:hypothetical protein [Pseudomonadota bacterium]